jgi:hypothetical protein
MEIHNTIFIHLLLLLLHVLNLKVKAAHQQVPEETEISLFNIASTWFSAPIKIIHPTQ